MVIMDAYYSPDRLHEIWQTIDQLHLSYLELEESPEKIDYRIRLEDCIREFLCIASHSKKFFLRETANVLYRSASTKKDFSGYKAATGWNAIQMYAGNLLSQPWRKEYRQIKTYCGFYKHQIEANLVGAEIMFEVMGYKYHSNGILVLEGPICPDTVTNVSKDCLIAYVECQIMKAIWEEISPTFKLSWLEVLEFRKTHLCSPEQSIRALNYQFHEKQYQAQNHQHQTQNADIYSRCHQSNVAPVVQYPHHSHVVPNIPPVNSYIYGTSTCCPNNYATYPYAVPVQYPPLVKPTNYYYTNGYLPPHQSTYGYTVPTGQLINLDSQQNGSGNYDVVKSKNEAKQKESEKEENHFEDWDYVYHKLESQGYSKDLGERGDILSPTNPKKIRPTNLDEAMQQLNISDRPLKIPEALQKYTDEVDNIKRNVERRRSESSSYENLTEVKKPIVNKAERRKTLPMKEKNVNGQETNSKTLDRKDNKWECKACTYHNENYKDICEMCSKSRTNVEQLMEIGGPQCSKCTLVNAKDSKVCQACGASLKDSPTYI